MKGRRCHFAHHCSAPSVWAPKLLIKETKELDDYENDDELFVKPIGDSEYEFQLSKERLADYEYEIYLSEKTIADDEYSIAGSRLETHRWASSSSVHGARNNDEDDPKNFFLKNINMGIKKT